VKAFFQKYILVQIESLIRRTGENMQHTFNIMQDIDLIRLYRENGQNNQALELILMRHSRLLSKIAYSHTQRHPYTTLEDNLQNARLGAIFACKRFDLKSKAKFSTYLYTTVYNYLLTCNDKEAFINCPTNMRETRSLFTGKYDNNHNKKDELYKKYKIQSEDDIRKLSKKYALLNPDCVNVVDGCSIEDVATQSENSIISSAYYNIIMDALSSEDQLIIKLAFHGYSNTEIAKIMSNIVKGKYTEKKIKQRMNKLKQKFVEEIL
jgi:RNA polymerase sigma factor (sigma-70 family)